MGEGLGPEEVVEGIYLETDSEDEDEVGHGGPVEGFVFDEDDGIG